MSMQQKMVKGALWSAIQSWGSQFITLLVFLLLARLLAPEDFGLVSFASVFISFLYILQDQGFSQAIIQRQDLEPEHLDTAFWTNIGVGILLTLICVVSAGFVADGFNQPQIAPLLRWLSLNFILSSFNSVQQAILQRNFGFKSLALRTLIASLVSGVVGVVMALTGFGIWSLIAQQLTRQFVRVLVLWQVSDWRPGFRVSLKHFHDLFAFGINLTGINALFFLNTRSDDFLIGTFLGPVALGYYSVAYRLPVIAMEVLNSVKSQVTMPAFSRLQEEPERVQRGFYKITQLTSVLACPAFIGLAVVAPEVVLTLFGEQWIPSIPVLRVLSFSALLFSIQGFSGNVITALGKPGWSLKANFLNSVVNVIGFSLALRWGIVAVAAAFVIGNYLISPVRFLMVRKLAGIDTLKYLHQFTVPLLGSLTMAAVLLGLKYWLTDMFPAPIRLGIYIAVGAVIYSSIIILFMPKLIQQIRSLASLALPQFLKRQA
jgi:O-antigen/teichoic acid export membrane protein